MWLLIFSKGEVAVSLEQVVAVKDPWGSGGHLGKALNFNGQYVYLL